MKAHQSPAFAECQRPSTLTALHDQGLRSRYASALSTEMIHLRSSSVNVALKISDAPLIVLFQQGLARVGFMCIAEGDAAAVLIFVLGRSTRAASCSGLRQRHRPSVMWAFSAQRGRTFRQYDGRRCHGHGD